MNYKAEHEFNLIHEAVSYFAVHSPNHIAIDDERRGITYNDLSKAMNLLASELQTLNVSRNQPVAAYFENGIEGYFGILGILRADGCYVPLNPILPLERIKNIVDTCHIKTFVTALTSIATVEQLFQTYPHLPIKNLILIKDQSTREAIDEESMQFLRSKLENLIIVDPLQNETISLAPNRNIEEDLAYIIFTSGTSGNPKGVMISHRNVKSFLKWLIVELELTSQDRIANHTKLIFDICNQDIFGAFWVGATLCPITDKSDYLIPSRYITDQKITVWHSVPGIIGILLERDELTKGAFSKFLRVACFGGEAFPVEYARSWIETHPDVKLYNLYGPTEATIWVTYFNISKNTDFKNTTLIPIGKAAPGSEIIILDEEGKPAKTGEVGSLMIGGSQLSPGYWARPDLNNEKYKHNPFKKALNSVFYDSGDLAKIDKEGNIIHLGRKDSQIKYMGFRIELGESEGLISACSEVKEAVVLFTGKPEKKIVAVLVPKKSIETINKDELIELILSKCKCSLPYYMVPSEVLISPSLPRNMNGKIDRNETEKQLLSKMDEWGDFPDVLVQCI